MPQRSNRKAFGVESVKSGRRVCLATLAGIIASHVKAEHEGQLRKRIRFLA